MMCLKGSFFADIGTVISTLEDSQETARELTPHEPPCPCQLAPPSSNRATMAAGGQAIVTHHIRRNDERHVKDESLCQASRLPTPCTPYSTSFRR